MKNNPLISIIVPVYNGEKYISECIESIINQDYKNLQVIIVNDGSIDNSLQIIRDYEKKDNRIIVIDKQNGGVSESRNQAMAIMKGEYVCFIDQDDMIGVNYISYLYNLISISKADISLTPSAFKFTGSLNYKEQRATNYNYKIINCDVAIENMLYYKYIIAPWNKMISTKLIRDNNIMFDKRYFSGEGFLFSIQCFSKSNMVVEGDEEIYLYRCDNATSGMTKYSQSVINSSIDAQKTIKDYLKKIGSRAIEACEYSNWHTHCDCLNQIIGCRAIDKNKMQYIEIKRICKKNALCVFKTPINLKEKIKGILYFINPYIAAKIINYFRKRKFTIENNQLEQESK